MLDTSICFVFIVICRVCRGGKSGWVCDSIEVDV